MRSLAYVGASSNTSKSFGATGVTSVSLTFPASVQDGDLALVLLTTVSPTFAAEHPTDVAWRSVADTPWNSAAGGATLLRYVCSAEDASTSVSFNAASDSTSGSVQARMYIFRPDSVNNLEYSGSYTAAESGALADFPAILADPDQRCAVRMCVTFTSTARTYTPDTGWTEVFDALHATGTYLFIETRALAADASASGGTRGTTTSDKIVLAAAFSSDPPNSTSPIFFGTNF